MNGKRTTSKAKRTRLTSVILLALIALGLLLLVLQPQVRLHRTFEVVGPDAPTYFAIVRGEPLEVVKQRLSEEPEALHQFEMAGKTLLGMAVKSRRYDVIPFLIERGADPSGADAPYTYSPLMIAVANNDFAATNILLDHGADPHLPSAGFRESPLEYARRNSLLHFVQILEAVPKKVQQTEREPQPAQGGAQEPFFLPGMTP